jgi:hypothetical protein
MGGAVWIVVPRELANELVEAQLARPVFRTRGGPVSEGLQLVVETINTAADVVTLLSAPLLAREVVERIRAFLRRKGEARRVRIEIDGKTGTEVFNLDDDDAIDRLNELVASARTEHGGKRPD